MSNYIHDTTVHNTPYDIVAEKAKNAHYATSANWLYNDDDSHYHFSVKNISGGIPLYNPNGTVIYNETFDIIDQPAFDSEDTVPIIFGLDNNEVSNSSVIYTVNATQKNYYVYDGSSGPSYEGNITEYMGVYNTEGSRNMMARIPFRFTACFNRKTGVDDPTPDFEHEKPIARITKIGYGADAIDVSKLYINGPAYILGSCIIRRKYTGNSYFPYSTRRANSREMFFWMNTDINSNEYCSIYICPTNCKVGVNAHSLYHCSYTSTQCRSLDTIEVEFNTVLYVTFR